MTKAIVMCYCEGIVERAKATYKMMFHTDELPPLYSGKYEIATLRGEIGPVAGNVKDYLLAMQRSPKKFAYYMEWDDAGTVTAQYSLMTGKKLI